MNGDSIAKLNVAHQLVKEVRDTLCGDTSICACCGLTTYQDKHEWKMQQALDAALHRILKTREEMEILREKEAC